MQEKIGGVVLEYAFYDEDAAYSDGEEVETFILNVFKEDRDIFEVLASDDRWAVLYHLSPIRKNIVLPMDLNKDACVLEVGSGMGAITAPLSERVREVDCIELSKRRSLANAYRNKHHNNITIFVGNFNKIQLAKKYDAIVLIGVLEYAGMYSSDADPFRDFLKTLHRLLNPNGKIYIAIENRLGAKYLAGNPEDHWGKPSIGIEGYNTNKKGAKTFSKSELEKLLKDAGYSNLYFYYPFPDYKMPELIYSDDYLPALSDGTPGNKAYDNDSYRIFDEQKLFSSLMYRDGGGVQDEFKMLSNSFLVEALKA